jgi:hypothetical protein
MTNRNDSEYFSGRLLAEREAAATASCEQARAAHLALASEYEQKLAAKNGLRLVSDQDLTGALDPRPAAGA